jgi:hypothetical protein
MQDLFGISVNGRHPAEYCERREAALEGEVRYRNPGELLATPDQEVTDYLIAAHSIACPVLCRQ